MRKRGFNLALPPLHPPPPQFHIVLFAAVFVGIIIAFGSVLFSSAQIE